MTKMTKPHNRRPRRPLRPLHPTCPCRYGFQQLKAACQKVLDWLQQHPAAQALLPLSAGMAIIGYFTLLSLFH